MVNKPIRHGYIWIILGIFLTTCGEQPVLLQAATSNPTAVLNTPVPIPILIPITVTPSPLPTEPITPLITPDSIQVERWNEYGDALAKAFFKSYFQPGEVVCEWTILGQADQEIYVWAHCAGIYSANPSQGSIPAVIHIAADGSVENAEIPGSGTFYGSDISRMFPSDVKEMIFGRVALAYSQEQADRLRWRRGHPDEPPWIIFSALAIRPTQSVIPWVTPEPVQADKWKEYQTALASEFDYRPTEEIICEWEFLGQSGNEVYVWTVCGEIRGNRVGLEGLAIVYVGDDGSVLRVDGHADFPSEIRDVFPLDVRERYYSGLVHFQELVDHLRWRQQGHSKEPPLIISGVTSMP